MVSPLQLLRSTSNSSSRADYPDGVSRGEQPGRAGGKAPSFLLVLLVLLHLAAARELSTSPRCASF